MCSIKCLALAVLLIRETERPFLRTCRWRERSCLAVRDACRTQVVHQGLEFSVFFNSFANIFVFIDEVY